MPHHAAARSDVLSRVASRPFLDVESVQYPGWVQYGLAVNSHALMCRAAERLQLIYKACRAHRAFPARVIA
jgi:hypothetical protein